MRAFMSACAWACCCNSCDALAVMHACAASNLASRQNIQKFCSPTPGHKKLCGPTADVNILRPNRLNMSLQAACMHVRIYVRQRTQPYANVFFPAVRLNRGECKATHVLFWRAAREHLCIYIYFFFLRRFALLQTSATSS